MLFLTLLSIAYISYLVIQDKTIVNRSISFSYYEGAETDVLWGSYASIVGVVIWFLFPEVIPRIGAISLILVPIFGNFTKKPITYFHYSFACMFFGLMLFYTKWPLVVGLGIFGLITLFKKKLSIFWWEIIGITLILSGLWLR